MTIKKHIEFEHKYLVEKDFDATSFKQQVKQLHPTDFYQVDVTDTYYLPSPSTQYIYRHRRDNRLNQLTYKEITADPQKRAGINLNLMQNVESRDIAGFMNTIGSFTQHQIHKNVTVFYFNDVEIVLYKARSGEKTVQCVEFEVRDYTSDQSASQLLGKYEQKLGFANRKRCLKSLIELLAP